MEQLKTTQDTREAQALLDAFVDNMMAQKAKEKTPPTEEARSADGSQEGTPGISRCHYSDVRSNPDYQWADQGCPRHGYGEQVDRETDGPFKDWDKRRHTVTGKVEYKHSHQGWWTDPSDVQKTRANVRAWAGQVGYKP